MEIPDNSLIILISQREEELAVVQHELRDLEIKSAVFKEKISSLTQSIDDLKSLIPSSQGAKDAQNPTKKTRRKRLGDKKRAIYTLLDKGYNSLSAIKFGLDLVDVDDIDRTYILDVLRGATNDGDLDGYVKGLEENDPLTLTDQGRKFLSEVVKATAGNGWGYAQIDQLSHSEETKNLRPETAVKIPPGTGNPDSSVPRYQVKFQKRKIRYD